MHPLCSLLLSIGLVDILFFDFSFVRFGVAFLNLFSVVCDLVFSLICIIASVNRANGNLQRSIAVGQKGVIFFF